jgi:hypothetical protein
VAPAPAGAWPALPLADWQDTYATLHRWTQVVGKLCLATTPLVNHYWNVALRVTSRGLSTPLLATGGRAFAMDFDFVDHRLLIRCADGGAEAVALEPRTVADFHALVVQALARLGIGVPIWTMPVEIPDPVRFELDTEHRSYDARAANTFLRVLASIHPVLDRFRGRFVGKCSPVQFFWGSFDLAVTRFSGRRAPERPGADPVTREAYSHEVISHGFWPGGGVVGEPAFYAYAAPEPEGFRAAKVEPAASRYEPQLGEFVLGYEAVRASPSPEATLTAFLETTYDCGATLGRWDRASLER